MKQKHYEARPFDKTDERIFLLRFDNTSFFQNVPPMEFTQLDLLQIMKHLKGRNERLHDKFLRLLRECDKITNQKTDFSRKIPQRRFNGKLH